MDALAGCPVEMRTDSIGNLLVRKRAAPHVMLAAHMDEVGLMVGHRKSGHLKFKPVGGIDSRPGGQAGAGLPPLSPG